MTVLVTGSDGFAGMPVCKELLRRGYSVRGARRMARPVTEGVQPVVIGQIDAGTDWRVALNGVDTVVHLAARVHVMRDTAQDPLAAFRQVNVWGTKQLAQSAAAADVRHFIFVSSIKVNGEQTNDTPFSEADTPNPASPYAVSKYEAEQVLREVEAETHMAVTILRPPLMYGPGVKANFLGLMKFVDRGIPLPLGAVRNKRSLLGIGNFADLICHCVEHPGARHETFLISDGEDLATPQLIHRIASALGRRSRTIFVYPPILCVLGKIARNHAFISRLLESLEIDSAKVRRVLDWRAPYTIDDELERTARWYRGLARGMRQ